MMATDVAPNPHSFASVLVSLARQGYLSPWDNYDEKEEPPSPTRPVASYSQHERSGSQSSSSSQDSFYTLYDEPLEGDEEALESESRPQTPHLWDNESSKHRSLVEPDYWKDAILDEWEPEAMETPYHQRSTSNEATPQYTPRNSILVSTTTTIQSTPPGSLSNKSAADLRRSTKTETVIAANVRDFKPPGKVTVDYSKPLQQSTRVQPTPAYTPRPSSDWGYASDSLDDVITEEELLELEDEITPRQRPRTKNLAKIFGQDPKHTYPSPLSTARPVEVTNRQNTLPVIVGTPLSSPATPEPKESHIGDLRKKIAWKPTAISSAEEEVDRRDLAKLLGEDDTLVVKLFGSDGDSTSSRKVSSEKASQNYLPQEPSQESPSTPDSRRRPTWRSTAVSEGEKAADEQDLHELMLGDTNEDVMAKLLDQPPGSYDNEFSSTVGLAMTAGMAHKRHPSGPLVIPTRITRTKRSSAHSAVGDGEMRSRPTTGAGAAPASPPRPGTSSTITPMAAGLYADTDGDADVETSSESEAGVEAEFSQFSGLSPAAKFDMQSSSASFDQVPVERSSSRAETLSAARSIRRLSACVDPIRDVFRFNEQSHHVEPIPPRADSLTSSDSTVSDVSDQASPEVTRSESPVSETEGTSDRERKREKTTEVVEGDGEPEEPTTPMASQHDLTLVTPKGRSRHQNQPSDSTGISTISSVSGVPESDDEMSIISTRDLSQPPDHIFAEQLIQFPLRSHPSPLSSHSTRNSLLPRPQTAPSPHVAGVQPPRPQTARAGSPKISLDSAAPPPIPLVRVDRTSPDGSPRRRRRLGILRDTLLWRPLQLSGLGSIGRGNKPMPLAAGSAPGSERGSSERGSSERGSSERTSRERSRASSDRARRPKPVFDEAALHELLSQSVPYEQAARSQQPFRTKGPASVYANTHRRKGEQVPLGLDMLAEFKMKEILTQQSKERVMRREDERTKALEEVHDSALDWDSDGVDLSFDYEAKRLSLVVEENDQGA